MRPKYYDEVMADNPYTYWRFPFGSSHADVKGRHNFTSGFWGDTNDFPIYVRTWNDNGATFDTGDYAATGSEIPVKGWPSTDNITIEMLIRPRRNKGRETLISNSYKTGIVQSSPEAVPWSWLEHPTTGVGSTMTGGNGWEIWLRNGRINVSFCIYDGGEIKSTTFEGPRINPRLWSHLVVVCFKLTATTGYINVYLNSESVVSATTGVFRFNPLIHADGHVDGLYVAKSSEQRDSFIGDLDEIAIYGSGLSQARITAHYEASGLKESLMPERATVYEDSIWRVEDAPGSGVGPLYRLLNTEVGFDPVTIIRTYRKNSSKFHTSASVGKEHSAGSISGDQAINDNLFLLRGLCNKGTVVTPTNNGTWIIGVGAATAGTFTLTYDGQTTAAIAFNATAAAVASALAAISSIGLAELVEVTGGAPSWTIKFRGPLSSGGALTIDGTGLTGGAATSVSTAGGTARRWTIIPSWNSADDPQTYEVQKGVFGQANSAADIKMGQIAGLSFKWNVGEASLSGDIFGDKMVDPFTMETAGITDLPVVPVDPACISVWLGDHITGGVGMPEKLTRLLDLELNLTGKFNPLMTLNCDDEGLTSSVEIAPTSTVGLTVSHDTQGQGLLQDMRDGQIKYLVFEALAANINNGFRHRFKWTTPIRLTGNSRVDTDGVYSSRYDAQILYTTEMGSAIKFEIDTTVAAF